jgi:hypothetical protein
MDIAKFLSLLEDEALFFASAASMPDKFEGSRSRLTSALNASLGEAHAAFDARIDSPFNKLLRGYTYLSCWHSSPHESAAMWALYQHDGYGVAIQSTFKRLTESFKGEQTIYAGCVHYVDYDTVAIPDGNSYTPYLYKRLSFEHEREVRAIAEDHYTGWQAWQQANIVFNPSISVRPGQDIDAELKRLDEAYRNLEPDIAPRPGIAVPVDLGELVEKVYIAPEAPGWVAALIEKLLHRYDLIWPIRQSDLRRDPFY